MLDDDTATMRERWISQATSVLEEGRGHLGIVTFLRAQGLKPDTIFFIRSLKVLSHRIRTIWPTKRLSNLLFLPRRNPLHKFVRNIKNTTTFKF